MTIPDGIPDGTPTVRTLVGAMGGIRGLAESVLPTLLFLVLYTFTRDLTISAGAAVLISLGFVVARVGARQPLGAAIAGAIGIVISAVLAVITGRAENNFLPGIVFNAAFLAILLVSLLVFRPLLAVIVGFFLGNPREWLKDPARNRAMTIATWLWCGLFVIRLAVEIPLFLLANVPALGVARLITGVPLYALFLWFTWVLVRTVYSGKDGDSVESPAD
jgi:Protein of unknown function (DUF3159)